MTNLKTGNVLANGLNFAYLAMGEETNPLILCLHGYPDNPYTFSAQFEPLSQAGYYVVAPYMRGYAPTDIPVDGVYQTAILGQDIISLIDALGYENAIVFGHDWGATAAYCAALIDKTKIRNLITVAIPYGSQLLSIFFQNYEQQKRSWYVFEYQLSFAELAVSHDNFAAIENLWRDWSPKWKFTQEELNRVKDTLRKPGVLQAAIAYYRAYFALPTDLPAPLIPIQLSYNLAPIEVPTLLLYGEDDGALGVETITGTENFFPKGIEIEIYKHAGHFVHREKPKKVNAKILEFLAQ